MGNSEESQALGREEETSLGGQNTVPDDTGVYEKIGRELG